MPAARASRTAAAAGNGTPAACALLEAQAHVLEHVLELEQRRVVVLAHRPGLQVEHRDAAVPAPITCAQRVEVDAGRAGRRPAPARRARVGRRDGVVDQLDHLALAELAPTWTISSPIASKQRPGALDVGASPPAMIVSVPSSAFGDEPVTGASTKRDPAFRQRGADARAWRRRDRRHVDAQRARRARALRDAVARPAAPRSTCVAVDHHRDDDVARARRLGGRRGDRRRRARRPTPRRARACGCRPSARGRRGAGSPPGASP